MHNFLDFEKPIAELEGKIEELRHLSDSGDVNIADEVSKLQGKADRLLKQTYAKLSPWQKTMVARHPDRPRFTDYVAGLVEEFTPLAGDRLYGDDKAIEGGLGRFRGYSVMVFGHERGGDTGDRIARNFGMARPEGYRKAQRLLRKWRSASRSRSSPWSTPGRLSRHRRRGARPGRGDRQSIEICLGIEVPLISVIIGEGGSGGAIAIATANKVLMLEHSIYSVISPEGCASILWRSADQAEQAAEALKLTAQDLAELGVIDEVVSEPLGGAHREKAKTIAAVGDAMERALLSLIHEDGPGLKAQRRKKFLDMGKKGLS